MDEVVLSVKIINPRTHTVPILRNLTGSQREEIGSALQKESVTEYRFKQLSQGNAVHSVSTLKKVKSDYGLRDRLSTDVMEDVELEMANQEPPYIRRISRNPFHMMMWLDDATSIR